MPYGDKITDAELDIMKVLWKNEGITSPMIFAAIENSEDRNTGTLKTLLTRLVQKGAIRREGINERHYVYFPIISEQEYIAKNRRRLIDKMFNGSPQDFLLNFVKEESITQEELTRLIAQIDKEHIDI